MLSFSPIYDLLERAIKLQHICQVRGVSLDILRLDKIDPAISGNKVFKLFEYLTLALKSENPGILTFGGPFSNHLAATARVCQLLGIRATGIVRGNDKEIDTYTIQKCKKDGMVVHSMSRVEYRRTSEFPNQKAINVRYGNNIVVPMGGYSIEGVKGAALILKYIPEDTYTHICTAVGTATTLAGLLTRERKETIMAYPAIKGMTDVHQRLGKLGIINTQRLKIIPQFHFGGFAKWNEELISFMNNFYQVYRIPLDFVYTGKMMFGIMHQINNNYFPEGSTILAIHTGGLQGNWSLPERELVY